MDQPDETSTTARHGGVGPDNLAAVQREIFMAALNVARHDHDPASAWDAFVEAAWHEAALGFGFIPRQPWPPGLARPDR